MKKHQLSLDDTFSDPYHVFAIYSEEEAYRMAFILNQTFHLHLKRSKPISKDNNLVNFEVYEYDDVSLYQQWFLIHNHTIVQDKPQSDDLFNLDTFERKVCYIREFKKAAFLLKIIADIDAAYLRLLLEKLQNIPQIYTAKLVPLTSIKNQKLLIL